MRTATSSASAPLVLGFAAAAALAVLAASPRAAALSGGGGGGAPLTSDTCRVCHTDRVFGAEFSHRGLLESGDGCLTCHQGAEAHVAARGGRETISKLPKLPPAEERGICLGCHEEETFAAPGHLEPKGKDARCSACHRLHGGGMPVRAVPGLDIKPKPGAGAAPAPRGGAWARGRVEAGWRFVGEEEGRYDQDVNLDDGPRLFAVDVEAGAAEGDPRALRADLRMEGLGDPRSFLKARLRKADEWKVEVDARRDELPFLAQNGLHGGETTREALAAAADLRVSDALRVSAGYDALDTEGELQGTVLEDGVVLPVAGDMDRLLQEGWAALDFRGRDWHLGLRQGYLWEDGNDSRERDRSTPSAPDRLSFDDDSAMEGPVTSATAGADLFDGRLSVEARASRSDLGTDVDLEESRRGTLGASVTSRVATVEGTKDQVVDMQGLDAVLEFGERWALETGAERRVLREDGEFRSVTTEDPGTGPATTVKDGEDRVSQRITREYAYLRRSFRGGFRVRGGVDFLQDTLDYGEGQGPGGTVRSTGLFAAADGTVSGPLSVKAEVRTARGNDVFTALTPEDGDAVRLGAAWREEEGIRAGADFGYSALKAHGSDLSSRGKDFRVFWGIGGGDDVAVDLSYTVRDLDLAVDTMSHAGGTLAAGRAESLVSAEVIEGVVGIPLAATWRVLLAGHWARDTGTLPLRAYDVSLVLRWQITPSFAARVEYRRADYDEIGADGLDYAANILELAIETRF